MKRVIQRRIENELAVRLLLGESAKGATVRVDATPAWELMFTPMVVGEAMHVGG